MLYFGVVKTIVLAASLYYWSSQCDDMLYLGVGSSPCYAYEDTYIAALF
jgi:hypothetical protein